MGSSHRNRADVANLADKVKFHMAMAVNVNVHTFDANGGALAGVGPLKEGGPMGF
jgi:hypothetical protein